MTGQTPTAWSLCGRLPARLQPIPPMAVSSRPRPDRRFEVRSRATALPGAHTIPCLDSAWRAPPRSIRARSAGGPRDWVAGYVSCRRRLAMAVSHQTVPRGTQSNFFEVSSLSPPRRVSAGLVIGQKFLASLPSPTQFRGKPGSQRWHTAHMRCAHDLIVSAAAAANPSSIGCLHADATAHLYDPVAKWEAVKTGASDTTC
ncbi:hypothetical protein GQ53DRAFT_537374 [Thozetella sp. PMI_491]|nr:hypothetical protein GQ53DRAFT_537374 [Thozetella sp. PMI_491]